MSLCSALAVAGTSGLVARRTSITAPYKDLAERVHELEDRDRRTTTALSRMSTDLKRLQNALNTWTAWWNRLEASWESARQHSTPPPPPGKETL